MNESVLVARYPRLFHMAHKDAWPSIATYGLLSTSGLLDLFGYSGETREQIELARRPESVVITHPVHGRAVVRDNKPISDALLARCLEGIDPPGFYRLLNGQVFFWLTEARLETLLAARAYRGDTHLVITIETSSLLDRHATDIVLSPINSGATVYNAVPRGPSTFVPIADYDYDARRRARGIGQAIAELAVRGGVRDILDVSIRAELRSPGGASKTIWSR